MHLNKTQLPWYTDCSSVPIRTKNHVGWWQHFMLDTAGVETLVFVWPPRGVPIRTKTHDGWWQPFMLDTAGVETLVFIWPPCGVPMRTKTHGGMVATLHVRHDRCGDLGTKCSTLTNRVPSRCKKALDGLSIIYQRPIYFSSVLQMVLFNRKNYSWCSCLPNLLKLNSFSQR